MAAQLGDIVTTLTVDRRSFEQGMTAAETRVGRFDTTVRRTASGLSAFGSSSGRATFALLELSRGAEDAAVMYGTQGLAGALRGSANNLAMFATAIHPVAGIVTGLGAAVGSVLIPKLMETGEEADKSKQKLDEWAATFERIDRDVRGAELWNVDREFARAEMAGETPDQIAARGADPERELGRVAAQIAGAEAKRAAILQKYGVPAFLTERLGTPTLTNPDPGLSAFAAQQRVNRGMRDLTPEDRAELVRINSELADLAQERANAAVTRRDVFEALPGARREEQAEQIKAQREQEEVREAEKVASRKEREERVKAFRGELLGGADPNRAALERITSTLAERRDKARELFPLGGAQFNELIGFAAQAAIRDARELRSRIQGRFADPLASVATRGNAADALNELHAAMRGGEKSEEARLQEENNRQSAEMVKLLTRIVERLRESPDSVPTRIGF